MHDLPHSVGTVWDREAPSYDASREADPVYASCVAQLARAIPAGTTVCLDAGCGTGMSTVALRKRANAVVALDFSHESLRVLERKRLANVLPVQGDLIALPFADDTFDACACANALQHVGPPERQRQVVAELQRVTKPGGVIVVSVHHFSREKRRAGWIKEGKPGQAGIDYIFRFSRDDLTAIVPGASIRGLGFYSMLNVPLVGAAMQDLLGRAAGGLAARLAFGHMLMARTRKPQRRASAATAD